MGNAALRLQCASGGRKIRVLLPDGRIELKNGPLEVADVMIEHVNHMVVHCAAAESKKVGGGRPTMTILEPSAQLLPGHAYVIHPIPPQYKKSKISPLAPNLHTSIGQLTTEGAERNQEPRSKSRKGRKTRKTAKVSDSKSEPEVLEGKQTSVVQSKALSRQQSLEQVNEALKKLESDDDDCDIVLNLNMYMGWRPALDSIPESPFGSFNNRSDIIRVQPICV